MTTQSAPAMAGDLGQRRYKTAAVWLHWIVALLIIGQIGLAWYMAALPERSAAQMNVLKVHISIGLTILLFSLARLGVRLLNPPPPLPAHMSKWERTLSSVIHVLFYVLIIGLPLTGWAVMSFFPRPISFWGLIEWPHLPFINLIDAASAKPIRQRIGTFHGTALVWTTITLLALHVLGALKHQFDGAPVLWRMIPFLPRPKA